MLERALHDHHLTIQTTNAIITNDALPWAIAHPEQLAQVFSNLLGNALKYSTAQPRIHITAKDHGAEWLFCVKDEGIGFSMRHAESVFGMFQRLHTSRQYEGRGIGLALCKAIVERHGGKIWVQTEPGKGAAFFFTLPKGEASKHSEPSDASALRQHTTQNTSA